MGRWSLASIIFGTGLALGAFAPAAAVAADKADKETQAKESQGREAGEGNPEKRVDKAIQSYESRADQELEQTRKEIERLQKELTDLVETQFTMAVSLAELQAEMKADAAVDNVASAGDGETDKDRQRLRTIELNRELRQVQDNLRSVVQQKRNETDQFVAQMRSLRAQQRQVASERERNKEAERERNKEAERDRNKQAENQGQSKD